MAYLFHSAHYRLPCVLVPSFALEMKTPKTLPRDTSEERISPRRVKELSKPPCLHSVFYFMPFLPFIYTLRCDFYSSAGVEGLEAPNGGWFHFQPVFSPSAHNILILYSYTLGA